MKLGVALGLLPPALFEPVATQADRLGFESVWLPEHLVFPVDMSGSPFPGGDHPPVPPQTKLFDAFAYLSFLAGRTQNVRLGTQVYLLALRHPFVAARAIATLDHVSAGRAEVGVGAGWLRQEWRALGLDPRTRGRRLDEALGLCKRLFTEERVAHRGEFYAFDEVMFEPKPLQRPHPPILVGGESDAALSRAARLGDGWLGLEHTPDTVRAPIERLRVLRRECGRGDVPFELVVGGRAPDRDSLARLEEAGVTRVIVSPWQRPREAVESLGPYADSLGLA
jgi:probable F420-dependent oxidoreductase